MTLRTLSGPAMGSRWTARLACDPAMAAPLTLACAAAVEAVEQATSTWRPGSDLMRLNAAPLGEWVDVPPHLMAVLERALAVGRASEGLFDIGLGALVQAWGFGAARGQVDPAAIAALSGRPLCSQKALRLDPARGAACKEAAMVLDLSGIAKGYGVDVLAGVLGAHGVADFLCGLDGELLARGQRPDGQPWAVALEAPDPARRAAHSLITLQDRAIATSGSYRHFLTLGQLRISHSMNPRTGRPALGPLASVSVLHDSCTEADAWATVLMVLGDQAGPAFAAARGLQAIFLDEHGRETLTGFAPT